jgi:hypothetical protein
MNRELLLKSVLVIVGLFFTAAIYPITMMLLSPDHSNEGDAMMLSLYFALGIFLLLAVRNPAAHRNLIAFAAWSSFAHGTVMGILGAEIPRERLEHWGATAVFFVIGIVLIALAPAKVAVERSSAVAA